MIGALIAQKTRPVTANVFDFPFNSLHKLNSNVLSVLL